MDNKKASAEAMSKKELRDLTKKQAEQIQSLKDSEKILIRRQQDTRFWMRQFLASFPYGLIMVDADQQIKSMNEIACRFFQYSDPEVVNRPLTALIPEIDCQVELTSRQRRLIGRRKNGESFPVEVYVNSLEMFGEDRLFITVQDTTERQQLEQLRTDLIAMVSHDIRAPLTSVRVTLEKVAEGTFGKLNKRGAQLVNQGVHSIEYLNSLIKHLIAAEDPETDEIILDYKPTTIGTLINLAMNAVQPPGDEGLVSIETEFSDDVIVVDETRIILVLINLISNAVRHTPADSKVNILAGMVGTEATFEVIDRGAGIPARELSSIFERFKPVSQPAVKTTGLGLGLANCKAIIEKHNGRIWVESEEGTGSKFCFTLPIGPANSVVTSMEL